MENPCHECRGGEAAGQSTKPGALATRKLCQNDEIIEGAAR
jgi:hypothetical protein